MIEMRSRTMSGLALVMMLISAPVCAVENTCPQADPNFVIRKSESWYDLEYKGSQIHRIDSAQLKHDLFGGKSPFTDCDSALSLRDVMGVVVGWRKDLLIAFGVVRDQQGRPVRVNMLSWSPHAGAFDSIILNERSEFVVRYGIFTTRICWNKRATQRWEFSNQQNQGDPGPCTTMEGPFDPSQYLIPVF
jgi:hypothetical protein